MSVLPKVKYHTCFLKPSFQLTIHLSKSITFTLCNSQYSNASSFLKNHPPTPLTTDRSTSCHLSGWLKEPLWLLMSSAPVTCRGASHLHITPPQEARLPPPWIRYLARTLFFFFLDLTYSWETQREKQRPRQREKQAPCREPNAGLDPGPRDHALSWR